MSVAVVITNGRSRLPTTNKPFRKSDKNATYGKNFCACLRGHQRIMENDDGILTTSNNKTGRIAVDGETVCNAFANCKAAIVNRRPQTNVCRANQTHLINRLRVAKFRRSKWWYTLVKCDSGFTYWLVADGAHRDKCKTVFAGNELPHHCSGAAHNEKYDHGII